MEATGTTGRSAQILCPDIVGRDTELVRIGAALDAARDGRGGMLAFIGEPGIGKSRLARETAERARSLGMRTLRGRAAAAAARIPFRPFAEAIQPALRDALAEPDPALRTMLALPGEAAAETHSVVQYEAVVRVLRSAGEAGLVLVLEDLHWADADTLALVDFLADAIEHDPILCVATLRDEPDAANSVIHAIAARRAAVVMPLTRLDDEASAELARRALGVQELTRDVRDALRERAEGVPFVIEEMLTGFVATGDLTTLPHTYKELVQARLGSLDERARRMLCAAAVIGRRFEWPLLTAVTGSSRQDVLEDLRRAVHAKLVSARQASGFDMPFGFRHALVRDAILSEMLPPEIRETSARAAEALEDLYPGLPGEWCERAADLREAAGDPAAAARHLQEAAARALVRGALATAETMLERARPMIEGDRWHLLGVDRQLVEVLSQAGKIDRLREIAAVALEFVHEKRSLMPFITLGLGDLHLRLAKGLAAAGEHTEADEHLARAREHASHVGERRLLARIRSFESVRALDKGDLDEALAASQEAGEAAERLGLADIVVEALGVAGRASFVAGDGEEASHVLLRAHQESRGHPLQRIKSLVDLGEVEAAMSGDATTLERARTVASEAGAVSSEARAEMLIAATAIAHFDLETAERSLARCIDAARTCGLALLAEAQDLEAERFALSATEDEVIAIRKHNGSRTFSRAVVLLRLEDRDGARALLDALPAHPIGRGVAALLAAVDDARVEASASAYALADGLITCARAIAAGRDEASSIFAAADTELAPFPWWRHLARRLVAEAAFRDGWGEPELWTRGCLVFFDDAGHERLASACKALLRNAGASVPRKGRGDAAVPTDLRRRGITSREMDVLRLVSIGLGNREIAERLFLSPRTVETHVASLVRKLDTPRVDLATWVEPGA